MKKELIDQLVNTYPNLFKFINDRGSNAPLAFRKIETADGWFDLIKNTCEELKDTTTKFIQIKEKFGGLTIYHEIDSDDPKKVEVESIIRNTLNESFKTCELCGKPGTKRLNNWVRSLCDECDEKRK